MRLRSKSQDVLIHFQKNKQKSKHFGSVIINGKEGYFDKGGGFR